MNQRFLSRLELVQQVRYHKGDREFPGRPAVLFCQTAFWSTMDLGVPGQTCSAGVGLENISAVFEQVGTCSAGELFGVPHKRPGDTW
eukprot:3604831-Amphidinium_carterae.1